MKNEKWKMINCLSTDTAIFHLSLSIFHLSLWGSRTSSTRKKPRRGAANEFGTFPRTIGRQRAALGSPFRALSNADDEPRACALGSPASPLRGWLIRSRNYSTHEGRFWARAHRPPRPSRAGVRP